MPYSIINYSHHVLHDIPMTYLLILKLEVWTFWPPSPILPHPLPLHPSICSLYLWAFLKKIPHISEIKWYLSFSIWLISLSLKSLRSIHVFTNGILFYGWVIFYRIRIPHLLYPFFCWWTLRLFSHFGFYKSCCSEHGGAYIFSS